MDNKHTLGWHLSKIESILSNDNVDVNLVDDTLDAHLTKIEEILESGGGSGGEIKVEVAEDIGAPAYDETSAYAVGAIVSKDGFLYCCTSAIAEGGEAWNPEHWQEGTLAEIVIGQLNAGY